MTPAGCGKRHIGHDLARSSVLRRAAPFAAPSLRFKRGHYGTQTRVHGTERSHTMASLVAGNLTLDGAQMALSDAASTHRAGGAARPVRVTHIVWNFDGGGLESVVASLARALRGSAVHTSVISLSGRVGRLGVERREDFDHVLAIRPRRVISMIAPIGLAKLIRRTKADVVHLHSGVWFKGAVAARLAGVQRVIFTEHGREHNDPFSSRLLDATASLLTDVVVPVSSRLESYLHRRLHIPINQLRTIPNGVDTRSFVPADGNERLRNELAIPKGALVIGSVGRLSKVKRFDHLITALGQLMVNEDPDRPIYLLLCGDGPEEMSLREQGARVGVLERCRLMPWSRQPADVYRTLDVFLLPSQSEGLSMSLLEAMACGTAPIVTDVGANREVLGAEAASQVVPADDVDALTSAIARFFRDSRLRAEAGRAARRRVVEAYDITRVARAYSDLYLEAPVENAVAKRSHALQ
jgi:glycosyltransferase involved in cell wall biosynthesis